MSIMRISLISVISLAGLVTPGRTAEPVTTIRLWQQDAPGALGQQPADIPQLSIYLPEPDKACGTGIVVCPGGGYQHLAVGHEGVDIAAWLNDLGIAAFVLDYRHRGKGYGHPAPLLDAQRAIRTVRSRAPEWRVDPHRIGVMGFSAGGHLAATAGTHFDAGQPAADDPVERVSCRPDFLVLCYPVIAFGESFTHTGSQRNLLGTDPPPDLVYELSAEKQVTAQTPPAFLFHTDADRGVAAENSLAFYTALRKANVPAELHIYAQGNHGVGLARGVPGTADWPERLAAWLRGRDLLPPESPRSNPSSPQ
jgi:acetyl esterase/lipase